MKNFKRTISAILIAISLASTVSSFFVVETVYALTAKQQKAAKAKADAAAAEAKKVSDANKAKEADIASKNTAAAEKLCTDAGYASCAAKKVADDKAAANTAAADKNSITNGTFSVKDQLKLDGDNQEKAYFKGTGSPIVNFVMTIINYAITIMGAIAVILFIVAGFMFMAANGESQKLDNAKDIIKYAAIGLIVALLSYIITIFVQSIFANG